MTSLLHMLSILRTASRYRLAEMLPAQWVSRPVQLMLWLCGLGSRKSNTAEQGDGERLRLALQDLGPIYIKFGQLLSTRRDMLPPDIADQLALLQDQVEPFDGEAARRIVESNLKNSLTEVFSSFDVQPLASASVAQVHAAHLAKENADVVVKIIRPGIRKTIDRDIRLLFFITRLLERHSGEARRLHLVDVVGDYQSVIHGELDLKQEAANTSQLKHNFEASEQLRELLHVPAVFWDYTSEQVLVMERVYGTPVSNVDELRAAGTNLQRLAERGVEIFFTQVFEHNFFHADMHPGNIFVETIDPENPRYIALDCAIMGSLPEIDRYYVARILLGALDRDYRLVTRLYQESGWLSAEVQPAAFESLIRGVCEPIFAKPLSELSFGTLLIYLFQAARRFGMEVQPAQVLLQKTLVNIEGLGQQLYPQLDLWQTAKPFLERWTRERYSPLRVVSSMEERLPTLLETLPVLQDSLMRKLQQFVQSKPADGQLQARIETLEKALRRQKGYNTALLVFAAIMLTAFFSG